MGLFRRISSLLLGAALLAGSGAAGWYGLRAAPRVPGLFAAVEVVELGTHGQGETISAELTFRNDHDEPVTTICAGNE